MLNITPEMQRALGAGVLVLQNNVLYITNGRGWLLVVTSPDSWIDPNIMQMVRTYDTLGNSRYLNYLILNAKSIDFASEKFLPNRARKQKSFYVDTMYDFPSLREIDLLERAEAMSPSLYGDVVDFEELIQTNSVRPIYGSDLKKMKETKRAFAKDENAESYIFSFDDKIVNVEGEQLRAFREMGFSPKMPRQKYSDTTPPPMGLAWKHDPGVFGFFMALGGSGTFRDRKGRDLFSDAAFACWDTEEESIKTLCHPNSYKFKGGQASHLGDLLEESYGNKDLRRAVTSLMWKGWEVEKIDELYENARYAAYCVSHEWLQEKAQTLLENVSKENVSAWELRNAESQIDRYIGIYKAMGHLTQFDLSHLTRCAEAIEQAKGVHEQDLPPSLRR